MPLPSGAWAVPYAVSPTGLVHTTRCHHAPAGPVHVDRHQALAVGRRLARCCLQGLVSGAVGAHGPRLPALAPPKNQVGHGQA